MYTIEDKIREDVRKYDENIISTTRDGVRALDLPNEYKYNTQGNYYLSCLSIISKLQKQVEELTRSQHDN